jgi:hemoglobin
MRAFRPTILGLVLTAWAIALAGCAGARTAAPANPSTAALYDRLGGLPAITAVVDDFMQNIAADERVNARFAGADLTGLRQKLIDLVCQASGGPCVYKGLSMKAAHQGMNLRDSDFDALAGDLKASLDKFKVPAREQGELLGVVGSLRPQIVNNGAGSST